MRRHATVALVVFCMALPAFAQRTTSRASSSGHAAPAFHGSRGAPQVNRPAVNRGQSSGRQITLPRPLQRPGVGTSGARPPYTGPWRYRRPYQPRYAHGVAGYVFPSYLGYGSIGPDYLAEPDDTGNDQSSAPQSPDSDAADQQPDDRELPPWPYGSQPAQPISSSAPAGEDTVTLIFKDGRPPEQIHNYILTRNTLYVGDRHRPDIPVDQLDLAATIKVNRDAGVDFHLPDTTR
jgi:hypothetical protein